MLILAVASITKRSLTDPTGSDNLENIINVSALFKNTRGRNLTDDPF